MSHNKVLVFGGKNKEKKMEEENLFLKGLVYKLDTNEPVNSESFSEDKMNIAKLVLSNNNNFSVLKSTGRDGNFYIQSIFPLKNAI